MSKSSTSLRCVVLFVVLLTSKLKARYQHSVLKENYCFVKVSVDQVRIIFSTHRNKILV